MTAIAGSRRRATSTSTTVHSRELDWLMLVTVALCCLGLVMAVSVRGSQIDVGPLIAMKSQGSKLLAGVSVFLLAALLPMSFVRRASLPAFLVATAVCLIVPWVSDEAKGAHRWIKFGSFQFQPVEPARFFMVLVVAWFLARAADGVSTFRRGFLPAMGCAGLLVVALLLQPDNGNAMLVLALASTLALVGGVRFLHFLPVCLAGFAALTIAAMRHGYVQDRIAGVLATRPDSQVGLGLIAVGSGGVLGRGLGQGWMKMGYVPESHNDFVFAIIAEEFGFAGSVFVLGAFTAFGYICYRLVCKVRDPFLRYVVCGYALMVCMQAAVNLLVVSGWAPAKGIDLPFVSTGGTSLVICLAAVGLIGNAVRTDRVGSFSTASESATS